MYSPRECKQKSQAIEAAIEKRFGWKIRFSINPDGSFDWEKISGRDRYDLYPGMSKEQADAAVMHDILTIIRGQLPGASLASYEQGGKMHYPRSSR
jgi:hypothetical protein